MNSHQLQAIRNFGALIMGLSITLSCTAQDALQKFNADLQNLNRVLRGEKPVTTQNNSAQSTAASPSTAQPTPQSKPIKFVTPADAKVSAAVDDALPILKKVVAIHNCVNKLDGLRLLNHLAPPGRSFQTGYAHHFPGGYAFGPLWKYHDMSKCPSIQVIDNFSMLALNAMQFRVVYFAEDSGESDTFIYELRKNSEAEWQLWNFVRP